MALFNQTEIGLKDTSVSANVPNDPTAKLMYYLNCMCTVLKMDDDADINRLRNYERYLSLSRQDRDVLIALCILLNPELLLNKCIFKSDAMCGNMGNKFFELETVKNNLLIAGNVLIGGRNRQVTSIMTFKMSWLDNNWTQPMKTLLERQRQEKLEQERQERLRRERLRQQELQRQERMRQQELQRQERMRQQELQRQERMRQQEQQRLEWRREQRFADMRSHKESSSCIIL